MAHALPPSMMAELAAASGKKDKAGQAMAAGFGLGCAPTPPIPLKKEVIPLDYAKLGSEHFTIGADLSVLPPKQRVAADKARALATIDQEATDEVHLTVRETYDTFIFSGSLPSGINQKLEVISFSSGRLQLGVKDVSGIAEEPELESISERKSRGGIFDTRSVKSAYFGRELPDTVVMRRSCASLPVLSGASDTEISPVKGVFGSVESASTYQREIEDAKAEFLSERFRDSETASMKSCRSLLQLGEDALMLRSDGASIRSAPVGLTPAHSEDKASIRSAPIKPEAELPKLSPVRTSSVRSMLLDSGPESNSIRRSSFVTAFKVGHDLLLDPAISLDDERCIKRQETDSTVSTRDSRGTEFSGISLDTAATSPDGYESPEDISNTEASKAVSQLETQEAKISTEKMRNTQSSTMDTGGSSTSIDVTGLGIIQSNRVNSTSAPDSDSIYHEDGADDYPEDWETVDTLEYERALAGCPDDRVTISNDSDALSAVPKGGTAKSAVSNEAPTCKSPPKMKVLYTWDFARTTGSMRYSMAWHAGYDDRETTATIDNGWLTVMIPKKPQGSDKVANLTWRKNECLAALMKTKN